VNNASASGTITATGQYAGGLIGDHQSTTPVTDVTASGAVTGTSYTGGLLGRGQADVINASAGGSVNGTSGGYVGGLVGYTTADITNANASGDVNSSGGNVGGLVGYTTADITNASASGGVTTSGKNVGGLIGQSIDAGLITDSSAHGNVNSSGKNVGGLIGHLENSGTVENVSATGAVTVETEGTDVVNYVGGLIGRHTDGDVVRDVVATGDVVATANHVGGLTGRTDAKIRDAETRGKVTVTGKNVGGLVGTYDLPGNRHIQNVTARGDISASGNSVGGLVGNKGSDPNTEFLADSYQEYLSITDGHTTGNVTSNGSNVGGILGIAGANGGDMINVSATGDVSADGEYVGGLFGRLRQSDRSNQVIRNAIARGDIRGQSKVGGLIGEYRKGSHIELAAATGDVNATGNEAGGLIGVVSTTMLVEDAYARGNVTSSASKVGGLVGNSAGADMTRVYASGQVEGAGETGGLVGTNSGQLSDAYWDIGATNQSSPTGDGSASGSPVGYGTVGDTRALEMQGRAPTQFMAALNYTSPWKLTSTYPIFQRESATSGSLPATVDTIEASTATVVQTQQMTVKLNATINGSRVGPGYLITVSDSNGLAELEGQRALTDQNGTATFTFAEQSAGTFTPTFEAVSDLNVTATATVEKTAPS
jgi:hypothetical protein